MKTLLRLAAVAALGAVPAMPDAAAVETKAPAGADRFVYFGTYTGPKSQGIYRARLEAATGRLSPAELAAECGNPSWLALHPGGKFLYAIDERSDPQKTPGRGVSAYALDPKTGALTLLNEQSAGGPGPCHIETDRTGRTLLVANYGGGSVAALPIGADGKLGAPASFIRHTGSSVHPRQTAPHAHAIVVAPGNRFALVPDLGLDRVLVYRLDAAKAKLAAHTPPAAVLPPGSGPRHLAFHPDGKFAYVINELLCTMAVFAWDDAAGTLAPLQTLSTLPPGESVKTGYSTAEVVAHPGGKLLYGSNRGHNSIVVYAVDAATGRLTYVENVSTQGKTPRNFAIDPSGTWLLAENQGSDTVVPFRIDAATGRLTPTGQILEVPAPVCAVFVPVQ